MPGVNSVECWSKLLHTIKRILAYPQSVKFILLAKSRWPQLFNDPGVLFVLSSRPIPKPTRNKSGTAEGIVGRMTSKEKEMRIFKDYVKTLQGFDLDERIKTEYGKDSFSPIVHSELLLLNHLQFLGVSDHSKFFNGWMYIGSSKPLCKLCHYYFVELRSEVEHRQCHGNLYTGWRVPDVLPSQGPDALGARQVMVDRVLQRVRKDTFDLVRKKTPPSYRESDSITFSATVTLEETWSLAGSRADLNEITSLMGQVDVSESR